ncbi:hypothetical protein NDU88_000603 [Pleurodeles waltl]|uniref:Uncharacterized protein n=1 Tax=Pleurodeles waltl TaxID=8319 RepID=A0AAV7MHB4_PLEWA|nr:hypothetical protein NDU88_000603 [Pleurodeles waltl]
MFGRIRDGRLGEGGIGMALVWMIRDGRLLGRTFNARAAYPIAASVLVTYEARVQQTRNRTRRLWRVQWEAS